MQVLYFSLIAFFSTVILPTVQISSVYLPEQTNLKFLLFKGKLSKSYHLPLIRPIPWNCLQNWKFSPLKNYIQAAKVHAFYRVLTLPIFFQQQWTVSSTSYWTLKCKWLSHSLCQAGVVWKDSLFKFLLRTLKLRGGCEEEKERPPPTTIKELQVFLALVNFYTRFLPGVAVTLLTLTCSQGKPATVGGGCSSQEHCCIILYSWVARFDVPETVTSDRGTQFSWASWSSFCDNLDHPQANGLVERVHRRLN
jgi:hypothetical protein